MNFGETRLKTIMIEFDRPVDMVKDCWIVHEAWQGGFWATVCCRRVLFIHGPKTLTKVEVDFGLFMHTSKPLYE